MDYKLLGEGAMVNQRSYDKLAEVEAIIDDVNLLPRLVEREEALWKPF